VGHSHWSKVAWIPFDPRPARIRPFDVAGNLLLCAPLGVVAGLSFTRGPLIAGALALALSLFVETMQLYTHSRFPSATDVVCNVTGAVVAAAVARYGVRAYGETRC